MSDARRMIAAKHGVILAPGGNPGAWHRRHDGYGLTFWIPALREAQAEDDGKNCHRLETANLNSSRLLHHDSGKHSTK